MGVTAACQQTLQLARPAAGRVLILEDVLKVAI